jgi:hypothetical protein
MSRIRSAYRHARSLGEVTCCLPLALAGLVPALPAFRAICAELDPGGVTAVCKETCTL